VAALENDAARARQGEAWRHQAEALSAQLHQVRRGQSRVELDDPYHPGQKLSVDLDPALPPHENASVLFKRARRASRGLPTIESRLQAARSQHAEIQQALAKIDHLEKQDAPAWTDVLPVALATWQQSTTGAIVAADAAGLWAPGGPAWEPPPETVPQNQGPAGPGRCFTLPGGWEVRVGRNNKENDELTHGFAHGDDVWLHASGVPGSHVVLRMRGRKDNPPRDILEMAAAIAARYSQAKHARTVPVIWTRKRYVRRVRRGAPGLASCSREKTLFVQPGLPSGQDEDEA
jgi:predicted ribosome quality control (RQC) complex YloA/Tae2 family protein